MWTLIVPLILGSPDYVDDRMVFEAHFASQAECEAERARLERRVIDAANSGRTGAWGSLVADRLEAIADVDQPEGVPVGWAYANPRVGYCASNPLDPSARGPNVTS